MADGDRLIPLFDVRLADHEVEAVAETLRSGWLTMGPRIKELEELFAERLGVKHAIATSSCTSSLHLAYLGAGVGPGDEVIVPAITFVASAAAVRYCGGTPVLADIKGPHDLGIDPEDVESRITDATKAVCAVHYAGYDADLGALRALCERRGLALIEDSAHNPIAPVRSLASCYSFFSNKVLSCGEGGLLATDDDALAEQARSLRSHAMTTGTWDRHRGHAAGYDVVGLGYNYRMDEPRAALLIARLAGLDDDIASRRALVRRYREQLAGLDGVTVPYRDDEVEQSSCYVMPVIVEDPDARDAVRQHMLDQHRVQTSILYPAIHEFTAYAPDSRGALPRSELAARTELTLPLFPHLSHDEQDRAVGALREGIQQFASAPAATAG